MESLSLKDIVCYLPNKLKVYSKIHKRIDLLIGLDYAHTGTDRATLKSDNEIVYYDAVSAIEPILFPCDLTKPITIDGREFIPLLELAKMFGFNDLEKFEDQGEISFGWNEQGIDDSQGFEFAHYKNGTFGVWFDCKDDSMPLYTYCSLEVIEQLDAWKIDYKGLIQKGLAVDATTLTEKVY